jgi:hypothetical protein
MFLFVWRTKQFRSNARQKPDREFAISNDPKRDWELVQLKVGAKKATIL